MSLSDFTYAVSRIRMKEKSLLGEKDLQRLASQKDYEAVVKILRELSFGEAYDSAASILSSEDRKLWNLISELTADINAFNVFRVQKDFHNLKVCIKSVYSDSEPSSMLVSGGTTDAEKMYEYIKNGNYKELPDAMEDLAAASLDLLLRTGDVKLCDMIIDKAALEAVKEAGDSSPYEIIRDYAELFVALTDIRIAVRGTKLTKSCNFFEKSLCPCRTLDTDTLAESAVKGLDVICSYISRTKYKEAAECIGISPSELERYCERMLARCMEKQRYEPFSIGPLLAYVYAKQRELKAVRFILTAKRNGLDEGKISERIREMYV